VLGCRDVPDALVEWRNAGIKTYIYSSGSREAQVSSQKQPAPTSSPIGSARPVCETVASRACMSVRAVCLTYMPAEIARDACHALQYMLWSAVEQQAASVA
jgi:hypothetical protein